MTDKIDYRAEYVMATFRLAKSSPAAWSDFISAFTMYSYDEVDKGLSAPTSEMQVVMGMGRQLKQLRADFVGIEGLAFKVQEQRERNAKKQRGE